MVEHMLSVHETPDSILSTPKGIVSEGRRIISLLCFLGHNISHLIILPNIDTVGLITAHTSKHATSSSSFLTLPRTLEGLPSTHIHPSYKS